jgi:hypothetical protein
MRHQHNSDPPKSIVRRMYLWIDRFIRSHKTISIAFVVALLIIGTVAVKNAYSVGSCQQQASIKLIDESGGKDYKFKFTPTSPSTQVDSPFHNYVADVSKHFFLKIDEIGKCQGDTSSDPQIELIFVYRPLISRQIQPFNFDLKTSNDTKYIDSPWLKLTMTKSPKLVVRAAFIWNERQFLLDQALMSGASASPIAPPLPLDSSVYYKFLGAYTNMSNATLGSSRDIQAAAIAELSKRVPTDIMWLFLHSGNFDGQVAAEFDMDKAIEQRAEQYTELTKELLNYRFGSLQTEQRYDSVLDLKDVFKIDKYRLDQIRLH